MSLSRIGSRVVSHCEERKLMVVNRLYMLDSAVKGMTQDEPKGTASNMQEQIDNTNTLVYSQSLADKEEQYSNRRATLMVRRRIAGSQINGGCFYRRIKSLDRGNPTESRQVR